MLLDMKCYSILRCKCCNTYDQALAHANEYYVCNELGEEGGYVEYNGNVYFIAYGEGAHGTLEEPVVKSFDDNCIIAESYSGYYDAYARFTLEKIDGNFKITEMKWLY